MPNWTGQLRVEVLGDEIVVILPGTSYGITYYKPAHSPQLLAKDFRSKVDSRAPITYSEFLAQAWRAANTKARELEWIV
jgi:hypothetical protein